MEAKEQEVFDLLIEELRKYILKGVESDKAQENPTNGKYKDISY